MINPYTSNPEDILIEKEESIDPAVIIRKLRKKIKTKKRILELALKEIPKQNREAQRNVVPSWTFASNSFDKDNIDPSIRFEDFLLAIG
jgi:hypothetical protein